MVEKYIKNKLLLFIFTLCLLVNVLPANTLVLATENLEVELEYGISGKFKAMSDIPIIVTINNKGEDFQGEVQIDVPKNGGRNHNTFAKEISISAGTSKRITIPIKLAEEQRKVFVKVVPNKGKVIEKSVLIDSGRVNDSNTLVGMLTEDSNALSFFGNVLYPISNNTVYDKYQTTATKSSVVTMGITGDTIGDNLKNITLLDGIIINNFDTLKLQPEQMTALRSWVEAGGTLIVGTGINAGKTLQGFADGFIEGASTKVLNGKVSILDKEVTLDYVNLTGGKNLIKSGNTELINQYEKGRGRVVVCAYDLGTEPMASFSKNIELWEKVFSKVIINRGTDNYNNTWTINNITSTISMNNMPNILTIIIIFLLYIIIIGVVVYLVLKKINKRDYIWIVAPVISIVFGIVIYVFGSTTRLNDYIVNKINLIKMDTNGNAVVTPYLGISSSSSKDLIIQEPSDIHLEYIIPNNYYYGNDNYEGKSKLDLKTTYKGNGTYFEFKDNAMFNTRAFQGSSFNEKFNPVETDLYFEDGNLRGTVKNTLGSEIYRAIVVVGNSVWDLGQITDGEEVILDGSIKGSYGLDQISYKIRDEYYNARYQNNNLAEVKDKLKNIGKVADLIQLVYENNNGSFKGSKLVLVTDTAVNYTLDLKSNNISEFNTTAILADLDLNFVNKEGQTEYPLGYFTPIIENESGDGGISWGDYVMHNNIEAVVAYELPTDINLEEITLNNSLSAYQQSWYTAFKGECFIYNVKEDKYEAIDMVGEKKYKLKDNIENYISKDNVFRIKVVGKQEEGSPIPQISVKGRAK